MTPWSGPAVLAATCVISTIKREGPLVALISLALVLAEVEVEKELIDAAQG